MLITAKIRPRQESIRLSTSIEYKRNVKEEADSAIAPLYGNV